MSINEYMRPTPSRALMRDLVYANIWARNDDAPVDHLTIAEALHIDPALVKELCMELVEDGLLVEADGPDEED